MTNGNSMILFTLSTPPRPEGLDALSQSRFFRIFSFGDPLTLGFLNFGAFELALLTEANCPARRVHQTRGCSATSSSRVSSSARRLKWLKRKRASSINIIDTIMVNS